MKSNFFLMMIFCFGTMDVCSMDKVKALVTKQIREWGQPKEVTKEQMVKQAEELAKIKRKQKADDEYERQLDMREKELKASIRRLKEELVKEEDEGSEFYAEPLQGKSEYEEASTFQDGSESEEELLSSGNGSPYVSQDVSSLGSPRGSHVLSPNAPFQGTKQEEKSLEHFLGNRVGSAGRANRKPDLTTLLENLRKLLQSLNRVLNR